MLNNAEKSSVPSFFKESKIESKENPVQKDKTKASFPSFFNLAKNKEPKI